MRAFPRNSVFLIFIPLVRNIPALFCLPVLYFLSVLLLQGGEGVTRNMDPDYIYLTNGYAVAEGGLPRYFDSPGTTVQLLAGALIAPRAPSAEEFISGSESYYRYLSLGFALVNAAAIFGFGIFLWRKSVPVHLVVAWQAAFFLTMFHHDNSVRVNPETISVLIMTVACMLYCSDLRHKVPLYSAWAAFAMATKLYYLPLGFGILFLGTWRQKIIGIFVYLACFLGLLALYGEKFSAALVYFLGIATRTGYGGTGAYGWPPLSDVLHGFRIVDSTDYAFFVLPVILCLLYGALTQARERRALVAGVLAMALLFIVAFLKYPFQKYYIIPAILLFPWTAFVVWREAMERGRRPFLLFYASLLAALVAVKISHHGYTAGGYNNRFMASVASEIKEAVRRHSECDILVYGAPPYKPMSFWFAGISDDGRLRPGLSRMFPRHYFTRNEVDIYPYVGPARTLRQFFLERPHDSCVLFISSAPVESLTPNFLAYLRGAKVVFSDKSDISYIYRWEKKSYGVH